MFMKDDTVPNLLLRLPSLTCNVKLVHRRTESFDDNCLILYNQHFEDASWQVGTRGWVVCCSVFTDTSR